MSTELDPVVAGKVQPASVVKRLVLLFVLDAERSRQSPQHRWHVGDRLNPKFDDEHRRLRTRLRVKDCALETHS